MMNESLDVIVKLIKGDTVDEVRVGSEAEGRASADAALHGAAYGNGGGLCKVALQRLGAVSTVSACCRSAAPTTKP